MIFLTEKERTLLIRAPNKKYIVTFQSGKALIEKVVTGKACGVIPLADEVSVFAVYDESGVESFVCDFSNFVSVIEKPVRCKKVSLRPLRITPTEK